MCIQYCRSFQLYNISIVMQIDTVFNNTSPASLSYILNNIVNHCWCTYNELRESVILDHQISSKKIDVRNIR